MEMTLSMLRYKLFGKAIQSDRRARFLRKSIADMLKVEEDAEKLDLHQITLKEGMLRQKKQEMTEAAKLIFQGDISQEMKMMRLHELFRQIESLQQECPMLSKTREALVSVQVGRDKELASVILEKHILSEHHKRKIRGMIRPSLQSLDKKATRLQMDRELEDDLREDMSSLLKEDESHLGNSHEKDDERFSEWLDTLKCSTPQIKVSEETSNLRRRITEMRSKMQ